MKNNFTEPVVRKTKPLYTKKSPTYVVGKQYLDHGKDVFSHDIYVRVKSKIKSFNFRKWENNFKKYQITILNFMKNELK